jgi:hypothetical protein
MTLYPAVGKSASNLPIFRHALDCKASPGSTCCNCSLWVDLQGFSQYLKGQAHEITCLWILIKNILPTKQQILEWTASPVLRYGVGEIYQE